MFEAKSEMQESGGKQVRGDDPLEDTDAKGQHLCECNEQQLIWYSSRERKEMMLLFLVHEQLHFLVVCSDGSI